MAIYQSLSSVNSSTATSEGINSHLVPSSRIERWIEGLQPALFENPFPDAKTLRSNHIPSQYSSIDQSLSSVSTSATAGIQFYSTPPSWLGGAVPLPPLFGSFAMHPFLDAEMLRSDYLFDLSSRYLPMQAFGGQFFRLSDYLLWQPATYPPVTFLRIICDAIPEWSINVGFNPASHYGQISPYAPPLTLGDVLRQIHRTLHERASDVDWYRLDHGRWFKVCEAFSARCKREGPSEEERLKNAGFKKVDYLLDNIWFKGLIRTGEGPEVLKLMVLSCN